MAPHVELPHQLPRTLPHTPPVTTPPLPTPPQTHCHLPRPTPAHITVHACQGAQGSAPGALATLKERVAEFDAPPLSLLFDPAVRDARSERSPETDEGLAAFKEKRKPNWYL